MVPQRTTEIERLIAPKDALDEADIDLGKGSSEQIIMVRCRNCEKLNEEDSKSCQECGKLL